MLLTPENRFAVPSALKPKVSASRHRPFRPFGGRSLSPAMLGDIHSPRLVTLFRLLEHIITELTHSMHVNFSQAKHSACTGFNLFV